MNWKVRIGIMFGLQYVFVRTSRRLTFKIHRAYRIDGRWYTCSADMGDMQQVAATPGNNYWMLTNENKIKDFTEFEPGTMVASHDLWFPLTRLVHAWVAMQDE